MPIVNRAEIRKILSKLRYPLYFLDYETYQPSQPWYSGYKKNECVTFQYSLHVKKTPQSKVVKDDGFHYLERHNVDPATYLLTHLKRHLGFRGSVIAWNSVFEESRNKEMARRRRKYSKYLKSINARMFDLAKIFRKKHYTHPRFHGSWSLKAVLPVLTKLSYKKLSIQDGWTASTSWPILIGKYHFQSGLKKEKLYKDMLEYCALDTFGMVKILERLKKELR